MKEATARELFDANAESYDRVNSVISVGMDSHWRDWAARTAVTHRGVRVLDAFAGTGLVGLRCAALGAEVTLADVSPGMLGVARRRAEKAHANVQTLLVDLTTHGADVPGAPFDAITMVFGARYLDDPARVIHDLASTLDPAGRFVLIDFVEPDGSLLSRLAAVYFFRILPRLASALAGRRELYQQLTATTHAMGSAKHLISLVEAAGLEVCETKMMGFGLVCGVMARRSSV